MDGSAPPAPRQRIEAERARRGDAALIAGCVALLNGRADNVDDPLITVLGGNAARHVLDAGEGGRSGYWPRVWAARGLLYAWKNYDNGNGHEDDRHDHDYGNNHHDPDPDPDPDHHDRHHHEHGHHHVGADAATDAVITATRDPAWRVRELAAKVVARHHVEAALDAVAALRDDPVPRVRTAAERAVILLTATA